MRRFMIFAVLLSIALLTPSVQSGVWLTTAQSQPAVLTSAPISDHIHVPDALHSGPVMFIENVGQFAPTARFQVPGGTGTMWLSDGAIWITRLERVMLEHSQVKRLDLDQANVEREDEPWQGVNLKLSFPGANSAPRIEPFDRLDTVVSYFIGNDPDQWCPDVPVWGGVRYVDLYPGIDLELTGTGGQWQPRIIARPGADLSAVRLHVEGAKALAVDEDGRLHLTAAIGVYTLPLFQLVTAHNSPVPTLGEMPTVRGNDVLFPFASLTVSGHSLSAISPADNPDDLLYSTFLGGGHDDWGRAIAVDSSGAAYVTGTTYSPEFPTTPGAFDTTGNGTDGFVAKLNAAGSDLIYSTFLGGSHFDTGSDIVVGTARSIYVTGLTRSSDFPTTLNAFDTTYNGAADAFAVKLNASGSGLVYSTLLGGSDEDIGFSIAVDADGAAYIAGEARYGYPTTSGAFDTTYNGGSRDAFVTKLNATGSDLVYSTFLGGSGGSFVYEGRDSSIAVDGNGAAYVTGYTGADDFPTTAGAFDTALGGNADAFVTKLNSAGSALVYSTYLGGADYDKGYAIVVDESGAAYIAGAAKSDDFPTTDGAYQTTFNGGTYDAFLTKLQADGSRLAFSTFLGGDDYDCARGVALDGERASYVTGGTESPDFPVTPDAFDTTLSEPVCPPNEPCNDVFVAKLDADGRSLVYGTFLGAGSDETARDIAVGGSETVYVTGGTDSSNFPTTPGAFDTVPKYFWDGFVARFAMGSPVQPPPVITNITPNSGNKDEVVHITNLAGTNFQSGATVKLTKSGQPDINATNVNVASASKITCNFDLIGATIGAWDVVVTNPDAQSGTLPGGFTVQDLPPPPPEVDSITPASGTNDGVAHITNLAGSNFQSGATVKLTKAGETDINATNVDVISASRIACDFDLRGASPGRWTVRVTNPDAQYAELVNGFTVNGLVYLSCVMSGWPPIPDTPALNAINNPDGDGNYTVSWNAADRANTYTLQEDDNPAFSSPSTVYSGPGTSKSITGRDVGTYHYRVKASNQFGSSDWSNTESVLVTVQPTGPKPGHYTGTPSVSFDVTEDQQVCNFDITIPFDEGTCQYRPNCTAIVDNEFGWEWDHDPFAFTSSITGRFDTRTHASGNYRMYVCESQMIFTPSEGTWEASK